MHKKILLILLAFQLVFSYGESKQSAEICEKVEAITTEEVNTFLFAPNSKEKKILDAIFDQFPKSFKDEKHLTKAGFQIIAKQPTSHIVVVRHPLLPNYVIKGYLKSGKTGKDGIPGWKWLVQRCKGAKKLRQLISQNNIKHFVAPQKHLYRLKDKSVILIATDMQLVSGAETEHAWKHFVTKEHLDELYCILHQGYASAFLTGNIPYTKSGKFACVDTEKPRRRSNYKMVKAYLSPDMIAYWKTLTE